MNRKIATIAIIVAFVGGMVFAGTPVEAKKGGGGSAIELLGAQIEDILVRLGVVEQKVQALENQIFDAIVSTHTITYQQGNNPPTPLEDDFFCPSSHPIMVSFYGDDPLQGNVKLTPNFDTDGITPIGAHVVFSRTGTQFFPSADVFLTCTK